MNQNAPDGKRRPPRVTIKDVARAAEVSPSTVSHAFSGRRAISDATKDRVFDAATRLGYSPDPGARSMRTRRYGMIGLVLRPQFATAGDPQSSETFNRLAGSMAIECLRRGIGLVHVPDPTRPDYDSVPMDGCVVAHPYADDPVIDFLLSRRIPVVCADPDPNRPELPWTVAVDYASGMRAAFDTVRTAPGDAVWLLPGSEENAWNREARRVHAEWCHERRLTPTTFVLSESLSPAEAEERLARLIAEHGTPDGIVFSLSKLSESIQGALAGAGLSSPDDVQLASLTDSSISRTARPPITALDLNHEELAARAVGCMMAQLAGEDPPARPLLVSPTLNVRDSTRG